LLKEFRALMAKYPGVLSNVRGKGLLIGLDFPSDAIGYQCAGALFRRGVLVAGTYSKAQTIRIEPALGISMDALREMLNRMEDSFNEIASVFRPRPAASSGVAAV
jgi:putrescine aminotransferase